MYTTFHLEAGEIDENFFKAVKAMFEGRSISITIEEEMDETEYLLSSEANRKVLMQSLENVKQGKLTKVDIDQYLGK